jgi:hypothetical protein
MMFLIKPLKISFPVGFSLSFWVKVTSWNGPYNHIIGRWGGMHIVRQGTSDTISLGGNGGGGICMLLLLLLLLCGFQNMIFIIPIVLDSVINVNDGNWHHVVAVADETDLLGGTCCYFEPR